MNISLTFKNFEPSPHLRKYANKRFGKLLKFDKTANAELNITLEVEKFRHIVDATLTGDNMNISATEKSEDMYQSIDLAVDKMNAQVRKLREKSKDRYRRGEGLVRMDVVSFADAAHSEPPTIVETDSYPPKPMAVEEAAMQLDSLQFEFLVFLNAETERPNVIYRRKDGNYGLIDPGTD
ncbi:ribosome hibernation-promoting factor, HPF/YfiA family [Desulfobaculum bizertense]|uniref:Ribosome hibernation promoting factor n=1 Tax=Desulfobaculum bizertense DSM 18034 TaxID=1121442 RepID=A0A1T4W497_9BACT|nr:ribosome-associated translation inhibitor RaiA [Desulfobaculum bizertense]UIJ38758.1 ribosome-associated translation inhibitor RaiA [Desulfobaculum bizertense]SKA71878.1 putative sigma-54 modulation protein [Desulfobaculum bizertense DSM 18034]